MNITNTMCRLSELSQWEIDSLVSAMPSSPFLSTLRRREGFIKIGFSGTDAGFWNGRMGFDTIVTYTQMMQLLGKTMQFTKSDLKTGMFVKYRGGQYRIVIGDCLSGNGCATLPQYSEGLKYKVPTIRALDIMAVYKAAKATHINEYLKGHCLTLIWERTEQTEAKKEMEVLQAQAKALQEQITKLQGTL
jgi:hypothetical protein